MEIYNEDFNSGAWNRVVEGTTYPLTVVSLHCTPIKCFVKMILWKL